jgi:hypothetical protein
MCAFNLQPVEENVTDSLSQPIVQSLEINKVDFLWKGPQESPTLVNTSEHPTAIYLSQNPNHL